MGLTIWIGAIEEGDEEMFVPWAATEAQVRVEPTLVQDEAVDWAFSWCISSQIWETIVSVSLGLLGPIRAGRDATMTRASLSSASALRRPWRVSSFERSFVR